MKPSEPEELATETTLEIEEELDRAAAEFFSSVEHDKAVDWRKFPASDDDDEEADDEEESLTASEPVEFGRPAKCEPQPGRRIGNRPIRTPEERAALLDAIRAERRAHVVDDGK